MAVPPPKTSLAAALAVLAIGGLVACGDDDSAPEPNHTVSSDEVRAMADEKLSVIKAFDRLGATPAASYETALRPDQERELPKEERAGRGATTPFTCYRFELEGGLEVDFAELCFRDGERLISVGISAAATGSGGPTPVPG